MSGPQELVVAPPEPVAPRTSALAHHGLTALFWLASHATWLLRLMRPLAVRLTLWFSPATRDAIGRNATRIFGRELPPREQRRFACELVGNFFDFVVEVGRCSRLTADALRNCVASIHGEPAYLECRTRGRGAILATAHMGSFEAGLAALRTVEPVIHVVFKRDTYGGFEAARSEMRRALGITEAPIDDGMPALMRLRDALQNNQVVVMQADRAVPGQRSEVVKFLGGHLRLPLGPIRLAQLTGSPIVPVFSIRQPDGRFDVHLEPPIWVDEQDPASALHAVARAIESYVARFPQQWLVLQRAFEDDLHD